VLGKRATRKKTAIRKALNGEIVEVDCGMVEAEGWEKLR